MRMIGAKTLMFTALLVAASQWTATAAQSADETSQSLRAAALNQLGVLEYCYAEGMIGEIAVAAQRQVVERFSNPLAPGSLESPEEEAGRAGFLAFGERQGRFQDSAMAQGLTLKTACEMRAASVVGGR